MARADEFQRLADEIEAAERALKLVRERITICRRDIAKMIATGIEEAVPVRRAGQGTADWTQVHALYRSIVERIPRTASLAQLEPVAEDLGLLADDILISLELHAKTQIQSANESIDERHKQNSNPDSSIDLEPSLQKGRVASVAPDPQPETKPEGSLPLGMVLEACPDILDYSKGGISNWRDLLAVTAIVRPMLGISPSAWEEGSAALGERQAAVVVAAILQKGEAISSAGGYLRSLTRKAQAGQFSLGPMLMALIGNRKREKMRA